MGRAAGLHCGTPAAPDILFAALGPDQDQNQNHHPRVQARLARGYESSNPAILVSSDQTRVTYSSLIGPNWTLTCSS